MKVNIFGKYGMTVVLFCCVAGLKAQQFASLLLEQTFLPLKNKCELPAESGIFNTQAFSLPLRVEYGADKKIIHFGIAVFSEKEQKAIGENLCNFQERYLLDVLLQPSDERAREFLNLNKTGITIRGIAMDSQFKRGYLEQAIRRMISEKSRYTLVRENYEWKALWEDDTFGLGLEFPSDVQLIMGMDKKEIGLFFEQQLNQFQCRPFDPSPLILNAERLKALSKDIFVLSGTTFFIKEMKTDIYFKKDSISGYSTVFDPKYPEESVANLFISPNQWAEKLQIRINHKVYDATNVLNKNLYQFLSFLKEDYETYLGIESVASGKINFTVIFRSNNYTFHHLLFVETTFNAVFKGEEPLNATLYTYIPNQNIKDLYDKRLEENIDNRLY